jgi:hypothetical protein
MAFDANDAPFTLHIVGETSDATYTGEFRAKKWLSHRDQLLKDQVRRELLGGQTGQPTERALTTSMVLAELRARLTKFPDWWTTSGQGLDLADDNVIGEIYAEATKIEAEAVEAKKAKAEKIQQQLRDEAAKKDAEEMAEDKTLAADAVKNARKK